MCVKTGLLYKASVSWGWILSFKSPEVPPTKAS